MCPSIKKTLKVFLMDGHTLPRMDPHLFTTPQYVPVPCIINYIWLIPFIFIFVMNSTPVVFVTGRQRDIGAYQTPRCCYKYRRIYW